MDTSNNDLSLAVLISCVHEHAGASIARTASAVRSLLLRYDREKVLRGIEAVTGGHGPTGDHWEAVRSTFSPAEKEALMEEVLLTAFSGPKSREDILRLERIASAVGLSPGAWRLPVADASTVPHTCTHGAGSGEEPAGQPSSRVGESFGVPEGGHDVTVKNLTVHDLTARYYTKSKPEIFNISFSLDSGELMAVLGPSGSGKSSIISALLDKMAIEQGVFYVNGHICPRGLFPIRRHLGHAPQADILDGILTVRENLLFYQKLKTWSHQPQEGLERRIEKMLESFDILHKRDQRVSGKAKLSGGQRRRLNMGMELLNNPDILILDEPTSGLSSRDSERVVSELKDLTRKGAMVIIVIHQPSSVIYKMFDKVLVLNREGEQLFFGPPLEALALFNAALPDRSLARESVECPTCCDVLPEVLLNAQEDAPKEFWVAMRMICPPPAPPVSSTVQAPGAPKTAVAKPGVEASGVETPDVAASGDESSGDGPKESAAPSGPPPSPTLSFRDVLGQLPLQIHRQVLIKSRDRLNQLLTVVIPPVLGILIALVFRHSPEGEPYSITTNEQYPHFLFLVVITGMFFGLMASVFEILKDEAMLQRERLNDISTGGYFAAKYIVLTLFGVVQCLAFLIPAHWILGVEHMLAVNAGLMALVTTLGIAFGLLFSTLTPSVLAAYNLVPLILIPQMILGGGFLPFDRTGDGLYAVEWACTQTLGRHCPLQWPPDKDRAPVIARLLPASWAYEFLITAGYDLHPVGRLEARKKRELQEIQEHYRELKSREPSAQERVLLDHRLSNEERTIRDNYEGILSEKRKSLNDTVRKIGSGETLLSRGDFKAPRHGHWKEYDGRPYFDAVFSKTWFLDVIVLLAYLVILLGVGFVRVKRVAGRR